MSAADRLRASVDTLDGVLRQPWHYDETHDEIATADDDWCVDMEPADLRHIALTASPDVVLALADLLDAIRVWRSTSVEEFFQDPAEMQAKADRLKAAHDRLEALITRTDATEELSTDG